MYCAFLGGHLSPCLVEVHCTSLRHMLKSWGPTISGVIPVSEKADDLLQKIKKTRSFGVTHSPAPPLCRSHQPRYPCLLQNASATITNLGSILHRDHQTKPNQGLQGLSWGTDSRLLPESLVKGKSSVSDLPQGSPQVSDFGKKLTQLLPAWQGFSTDWCGCSPSVSKVTVYFSVFPLCAHSKALLIMLFLSFQ